MLAGGALGMAVFAPHFAGAQSVPATVVSTSTPPSGGSSVVAGSFRSNEDPAHEATESPAREAEEDSGRGGFEGRHHGSNEDPAHEASESPEREAQEDAGNPAGGQPTAGATADPSAS